MECHRSEGTSLQSWILIVTLCFLSVNKMRTWIWSNSPARRCLRTVSNLSTNVSACPPARPVLVPHSGLPCFFLLVCLFLALEGTQGTVLGAGEGLCMAVGNAPWNRKFRVEESWVLVHWVPLFYN